MKSIAERTEDFALRIVKACGWVETQLVEQKKFTFLELNKQLFRSVTSIGANCQEARSAQSDKDYKIISNSELRTQNSEVKIKN